MKFLIVLASVIAVSVTQRPTYAGISSKGYPELASRFRDPADDQQNSTDNAGIGNRLGADDDQPAQNLPTDARGDANLVNRLQQWPRENRPFWLINAEHIERHRHPNENRIQQQQTLNGVQQISQSINEIQPGLNRQQGSLGGTQQITLDSQRNVNQQGQVQLRFGDPAITETKTIKPLRQRGSFVGERF